MLRSSPSKALVHGVLLSPFIVIRLLLVMEQFILPSSFRFLWKVEDFSVSGLLCSQPDPSMLDFDSGHHRVCDFRSFWQLVQE